MVAEDTNKSPAAESPAVKSLQKEQADKARDKKDGKLEDSLEDTFPASDPVSMTNPTKPGAPEE
ncbi:hypothetical protein [Tianweitania sp.]|uniref:hypothetical protein n=1 Tax=Tianweitania sp. TaxID=2021634 RepID=UPI0028A04808|nr:hypothetical protein [Tianweitania sp.]